MRINIMVLACEAIKLARLVTMFQRNWLLYHHLLLLNKLNISTESYGNKMSVDIYSNILLYQISHYI